MAFGNSETDGPANGGCRKGSYTKPAIGRRGVGARVWQEAMDEHIYGGFP
jgi:hypothetical protein